MQSLSACAPCVSCAARVEEEWNKCIFPGLQKAELGEAQIQLCGPLCRVAECSWGFALTEFPAALQPDA